MKLSRVALATLLVLLPVSAVLTSAQEPPRDGFAPASWSADQKKVNGTTTTRIYSDWKNYYDKGWKEIDRTPRQDNGAFIYDKGPYQLIAPRFADEPVQFTATTTYDPDSHSFHAEAPVTKTKTFSGVAHVAGSYEGDSVVYSNAHPLGDLIYKPMNGGFQALVRINSLPATCVSNPTGNVTVPFTETYSDSLTPDSIGTTQRNIGAGWEAKRGKRKIKTAKAEIWDSANKRQPITVNGRMTAGTLIASKVLPCSFLSSATYPVFTDTTSILADTGDGRVSNSNAAFATARNAASGDASSTAEASANVGAFFQGGTLYVIYRLYDWYDTTLLSADPVTAATITRYFTATAVGTTHNYYYVKSTAGTGITTGDFSAIGDSGIGTGDTFCTITRTASEAAGDEVCTLNAAGRANITAGDNSYFALVDAIDWDNSAPADTVTGNLTATSDTAGTTEDPVLEITQSAGGAGSAAKTKNTVIWF